MHVFVLWFAGFGLLLAQKLQVVRVLQELRCVFALVHSSSFCAFVVANLNFHLRVVLWALCAWKVHGSGGGVGETLQRSGGCVR